MIKQIRKISTASMAVARNLHLKKRTKDFVTYVGMGTAGTVAFWQAGKTLTQPIVDEFLAIQPKAILVEQRLKPKAVFISQKNFKIDWANYEFKANAFFKQMNPLKKLTEIPLIKKQKDVIIQIMNEDKNCPLPLDREKMSAKILEAAYEYGVDPIEIACIIKRETHFLANLNGKNGNGLMQITKIAVKDMYQQGRDVLYHKKLSLLKNQYKTDSELFDALKKKDTVNIRVGVILYKMLLKQANDNVYIALKNYNGSSIKNEYAADVMNNIRKYKKAIKALDVKQK